MTVDLLLKAGGAVVLLWVGWIHAGLFRLSGRIRPLEDDRVAREALEVAEAERRKEAERDADRQLAENQQRMLEKLSEAMGDAGKHRTPDVDPST